MVRLWLFLVGSLLLGSLHVHMHAAMHGNTRAIRAVAGCAWKPGGDRQGQQQQQQWCADFIVFPKITLVGANHP